MLFHKRIEPSEIQGLLYSRLGSPIEDVAHELIRIGFQCERSEETDRFSYGCSRFNPPGMFVPRGPRDWLHVDLFAEKGKTALHRYGFGEYGEKAAD